MKTQKDIFNNRQIFILLLGLFFSIIPNYNQAQGLEVSQGSDINATGGGYLIIDENNSLLEMAFDGNEIKATTAGASSALYLNREGGSVHILDGGGGTFSVNNNGLRFILPTNRLGIGTNSPSARLDVVGDIECNGLMDINGDIEVAGTVDIDNGNLFYDDTNNRLGIGTNTPGARLDVVGEIECNGQLDLNGDLIFPNGTLGSTTAPAIDCNRRFEPTSHLTRDLGQATNFRAWDDVYADDFVTASDMRLKSNVTFSTYGLQELLLLSPIRYTLIDDLQQEFKLGLSAQEAISIIPEVVKSQDIVENENGDFVIQPTANLGIKYSMLTPIIISAIKELDSKIQKLNTEDNSSQGSIISENEMLKQRIEKMEKQIETLLKK